MFNIGPEELLLILVIALIFVGPKRLPDMARQVGKGLREFRNITGSAKRELMDSVKVDMNAQPGFADGLDDGDVGPEDDAPVDISSLPVWDGTQDQPQVPGVNAPAVVSAPSNGNGSKAAKQAGKPKKKKSAAGGAAAAAASALAVSPTEPLPETEADTVDAPAAEAGDPVPSAQAIEPTETVTTTAEPVASPDVAPPSDQTASPEATPPATSGAGAAGGDGTETAVSTTDPVEP